MDFDPGNIPVSVVIDLSVIVILLISGALAFFRGAVREFLAIAGWVAAGAAAYYGFDYVKPFVSPYIGIPLLTDAITSGGIFIAAMVVLSLISGAISRRIKTSRLESLDRSLGFLFGLVRGALVVCIAYLVMVVFVSPEDQPEAVQEARSQPLVEIGAIWLIEAVPDDKRAEWLGALQTAKEFADTAMETKNALDTLMGAPPVMTNPGQSGYSKAQRKELDRLIGTTQ
ncbi:MAG: CvpA family protein [Proteobacteria bacterium]|nr:CvpA family protein [Pseudomonadota bacterium]